MRRPETSVSKPRLLIVGAFPSLHRTVVGGVATSCRVLLQSSLRDRSELVLVDSSQVSNPPPGFAVRLVFAVRRLAIYLVRFERQRPLAVLLFASPGASAIEKGTMAWYARLRGRKALIFPRGEPPKLGSTSLWDKFLCALCYRGAHKLVCQGEAWQRFAIVGLGIDAVDAPVIQNWTATPELLAIGQARQARGPGPVRLLFLGWLEREKGVLDLLEACSRLPSTCPFEIDFIGNGRAMMQACAFVAQHGLGDKVKFHGWLQGGARDDALARADVFVLPSWSEGLPNAMIEAMAARLAVVVTAVGNVPDVVKAEREVLLVPPRDVQALTEALQRVIGDPALRCRLGEAAFELARREFGVERAVGRILAAVQASVGMNSQ